MRARQIGLLFQTGNLVDHLTVEQNIILAQRLAGTPDRTRVAEILSEVGLGARVRALPATLSGGEAAGPGLPSRSPTSPR